ncbi:MAG: hypothetical protein Q8O25_03090 [Sulfurisoma sp.]|nr:hypothetical protein [Sulfurisoma sp.]
MTVDELPVVLLEIERAFRQPVQFQGQEFIRVGSYKKRLKDFPEKERGLRRIFDKAPFESGVAIELELWSAGLPVEREAKGMSRDFSIKAGDGTPRIALSLPWPGLAPTNSSAGTFRSLNAGENPRRRNLVFIMISHAAQYTRMPVSVASQLKKSALATRRE